jgi:arsenate reductase|tara:strand:+ start:107 stop:451 length:345 start_codon:yes stop_codon:yes gene_type:complete
MITIYHNPRCSKSRQALALLVKKDIVVDILLYLKRPPTAEALTVLLRKLGIPARQLLRKGEDAYKEKNLADKGKTDSELIDAMAANPKLIQRPIVVNGHVAVIGRPPERILEIV